MIPVNVEDVKKAVLEINGIKPLEDHFNFFYDETGNCRKFYLTEDGVNAKDSLKKDFILGGIALSNSDIDVDFESLHCIMDFKEGQKELKFKHLYKNSKDFLLFMDSKRAIGFLQWLKDNNCYIHYCTLNNLYYSLVDIVDSLYEIYPLLFDNIELIFKIKDVLYYFVKEHCDEIINMLYEYNYPNVQDCKSFCDSLCGLINIYRDEYDVQHGFFLGIFRKMLKQAGKENKLIFVQDNEPFTLITEYYLLYLERCEIFSKSNHIFDEEKTVEAKFKNHELIEGGKIIHNYSFVKSHTNNYVQVSDMVVGLLGKLFVFLDESTFEEIADIKLALTENQRKSFSLLFFLILKSDRKCKLFLKSVNSIDNINTRTQKLKLLTD